MIGNIYCVSPDGLNCSCIHSKSNSWRRARCQVEDKGGVVEPLSSLERRRANIGLAISARKRREKGGYSMESRGWARVFVFV